MTEGRVTGWRAARGSHFIDGLVLRGAGRGGSSDPYGEPQTDHERPPSGVYATPSRWTSAASVANIG